MKGLCALILVSLVLAACGGGGVVSEGPEFQGEVTTSSPDGETQPTIPEQPARQPVETSFAFCEDIEFVRAPDEAYRDTPIYVGNEQPIDEVAGWAFDQPGFVSFWVDRERNGWITLAFAEGADLRQQDLETLFPDAGAVAVAIDWTEQELADLQERVTTALQPGGFSFSVGRSIVKGLVDVDLGVLLPERLALVEENFAGEDICISGLHPDDAIPDGPQPVGGPGWRLLAAEIDAGQPYRTAIAWDAESYAALWTEAAVSATAPEVDFEENVVIWFGAVYGSGCEGLRLDKVVSKQGEFLVHAEIVLPSSLGTICRSDARPHAFVVTLERRLLPDPPFNIQLSENGPPAGAPEERTVVLAGLSSPGSVAGPDFVKQGEYEPPDSNVIEHPNFVIEPGIEAQIRIDTHCGIDWLGLNGVTWHAPDHAVMPDPWLAVLEEETIVLDVLILEDGPSLQATANGFTANYQAVAQDLPGCD